MSGFDYVYGKNVIDVLLSSTQKIQLLYIDEKMKASDKYFDLCKKKDIKLQRVSKAKMDELSGSTLHQGLVAKIPAYNYCSVEDILKYADEKKEPPFIIILDKIVDPHNLGAIIRTANIVGAHGVIIKKDKSAGVNATVYKTSVGAVLFTKVAKVVNISATIKKLKQAGVWVYASSMEGESMYSLDFTPPSALVIGNEGTGVSKLVKQNCDMIASIPMRGEITSLNASVASAVMMYEVYRQRIAK